MDGYQPATANLSAVSAPIMQQRTLKSAICCTGTALHSGRRVKVGLNPAAADSGIVFRRVDLGIDIVAWFDAVCDTRLCTVVGDASGSVGTIEHLMAALSAYGIGNALIEVDGPELPVLDGSAEPWLFLLDCAGIATLDRARLEVEVLRSVRVEHGEAFAELRPGLSGSLELNLAIDFAAAAIGRQSLAFTLGEEAFREVARARTFAQAHEIAGLQAAGLAQGGTLDNAIVVDGDRVLNPAGLRMADEFVRHKLLDAVGDLALGGTLRGRFVGCRSGHALNNQVLRALFADAANYRIVRADGLGWMRDAA
ncbi:MAG: UDP-3-O-acyl-N-acetylglucosamine deacetylase [Pseudomonadota bacterium]|nr:UDP-3-O-acyl-N-acetylglucosamine deacetylase [Pseudomonadota bacterium]